MPHGLRRSVFALLCVLLTVPAAAQEAADGMGALDGAALAPATLKYETTVEMGQRSMTRATVRTLTKGTHDGTPIWRVVDAVQGAPQADTLFLDRASLRPLQRRVGGQMALTLTFDSTSVAGTLRAGGQSRAMERTFDQPVLSSTANVEVGMATLPLDSGYVAQMPVYHLQQREVTPMTLRVVGTESVTVPAGSFDTFVVEATSQGSGPSGTYYVRQNAPHHVVKADLEVAASQGRTVTATKKLTFLQRASAADEK